MRTVTIDLPDDVFSALRLAPEDFGREMRLAAAIHWYHQGHISGTKAAGIAGLTRLEFLDELARRKLDVIVVDMRDLQDELARG
ncbi:MAG: UPF0175 family protein [Planctomycetes bacterium]|nr:UPF0175 family protein [Planctomycetota bacterium]